MLGVSVSVKSLICYDIVTGLSSVKHIVLGSVNNQALKLRSFQIMGWVFMRLGVFFCASFSDE